MFDKTTNKEQIEERVKYLIEKYNELNIIYLRVSTKLNQNEKNQLPQILKQFKLDKDKCLILRARESAYQLKKDNTRLFNIIKEIIEYKEYKITQKKLYVWHLNRIYRNRKKLVKFGLSVRDNKTLIFSVRQKVLSDCLKYPEPMNEIIYYLMLQLYGQSAQEESENKGKDLKKSLNIKNGRYHTNKGRIFGGKLRTVKGDKIIKGKYNKMNAKDLLKLELAIYKRIKIGMSYREIIDLVMKKKKIKISLGYLTNIKNKYTQEQ